MKTNHRTGDKKRKDRHRGYYGLKQTLKKEANQGLRAKNRQAIHHTLRGEDVNFAFRVQEGSDRWNYS
jgi:hypothetical protein